MGRPPHPTTLRPTVTSQTVDQVREDYMSGMTLWAVQHKWKRVLEKYEVRLILGRMIRPKGGGCKELSDAEVEERKRQVRENWTPEQASKRWVGRFLSNQDQVGKQFSKILRAMGGNL